MASRSWAVGLAMVLGMGCGGNTGSDGASDGALRHGTLDLQLRRADNAAAVDLFADTEIVRISFRYDDCLFDFYREHPEWQQHGREGEGVFGRAGGGEGWADRLCADRGTVDCDVVAITQTGNKVLSVDYEISGPLENRTLAFGPLPGLELADCPAEQVPSASLVGTSGHVDPFATSPILWEWLSATPPVGYADQGQELQVRVAPPQ